MSSGSSSTYYIYGIATGAKVFFTSREVEICIELQRLEIFVCIHFSNFHFLSCDINILNKKALRDNEEIFLTDVFRETPSHMTNVKCI